MSDERPANYSYRKFCDFVRRFNQEDLLTNVARAALALPGSASEPSYVRTPPWALAAIVKASICNGNPHRHTLVKPNDIPLACHIYNNVKPEELQHPELNSGFAILVRIAYEQFHYQESVFGEMARPLLFFDGYSGRKNLEVINRVTLAELIGAPLETALGVSILLAASAHRNGGFFDPKWMDQPNFVDVLKVLPHDEVLSVIDSAFTTSLEGFRRLNTEAERKLPLPFLDRYRFNPLAARPVLRLADGRLLAPVPQIIPRKLSPLELYYAGIDRWGEPFTRDMGELLEDYVGRQFTSLPDVTVHPEVTYRQRRDVLKSVDWIIVFEDLVVLIEAKATRASAGARAADETVRDAYGRVLGGAFRQISRTYKAIQEGVHEFAHIPNDRPIVAIVGTLDPWYLANSLARSFLPPTDVPTIVASVRDIEHLVGIGQRLPASRVLTEITRPGDQRQTWELSVALRDFHQNDDHNPLLMQAWERLPFREHVKKRSSRREAPAEVADE